MGDGSLAQAKVVSSRLGVPPRPAPFPSFNLRRMCVLETGSSCVTHASLAVTHASLVLVAASTTTFPTSPRPPFQSRAVITGTSLSLQHSPLKTIIVYVCLRQGTAAIGRSASNSWCLPLLSFQRCAYPEGGALFSKPVDRAAPATTSSVGCRPCILKPSWRLCSGASKI